MDTVLGINFRPDEIEIGLFGKKVRRAELLYADHIRVAQLGDPRMPEWREGIRAILAPELQKLPAAPERAVIGIPRTWAFLRFVNLPPVPDADLPRILRFEADRHLPFSLDDLYCSVERATVKDAEEATAMRSLLVAGKRSMLDPILDAMEALGLPSYELRIGGLALSNLIARTEGKDWEANTAFVDLRDDGIEITITGGGTLLFTRHVSQLGGPGGGMEELLSATAPGIASAAQEIANYMAVRVTEVLNRAMSNAWIPYERRTIQRICLLGEGVPMTTFRDMLNLRWECPVQLLPWPEDVERGEREATPASLRTAALAIGAFESSYFDIDLLPQERKVELRDYSVYASLLIGAIAVWLLLVNAGYFIYHQEEELAALEQTKAAWAPAIERVKALEERVQSNQKGIAAYEELEKGYRPRLVLLAELARILPEDSWVNDADIQADAVNLRGTSETASQLTKILEDSDYFQNVAWKGSSSRDTFNLTMAITPDLPKEEEGKEGQDAAAETREAPGPAPRTEAAGERAADRAPERGPETGPETGPEQ
ncbi:MAG: PilN domain-containing protein [Candidatus Schekmanbacteria bacterium]|nr:PilN domain-containing protein [Candidatus Schekmanbacteria bacterium]